MILLVLVCIATATLLVWLAVELGRIALGDHGYPRSVPAVFHGVIGAVRVPGDLLRGGRHGDHVSRAESRPSVQPPGSAESAAPTPAPAQDAEVWAEPWDVDETVERMVRERLYGNGHSSRRIDAV